MIRPAPISLKFFLILLFQLLLYSENSLAQDQTKIDEPRYLKHNIGIAVGVTTGFGLSYRYIPKRFGIQPTFSYYEKVRQSRGSIGFTFLYQLIKDEKSSLFLYQGNHFFYDEIDSKATRKYFMNGIGLGIEIIIIKRISFNLMGGYGFYQNFETFTLIAETGLYFKF